MSVKRLGFGMMRPPRTDINDEKSIDYDRLIPMVDTFLERGFTYFDTAWAYCGHESENAVRIALSSRHPRDKFTVATKLHSAFINSLESRDEIFFKQLEKTGLEYFDYYLLHDVNRKSIKIYEEYDCVCWIQEKKAKGLAKKIGFSYHDKPELLDELLTKYPCFEFVQLQLNYLDWESDNVQSRLCYEVCVKHGKPVVVMEPVRGGRLAELPGHVEELLRGMDEKLSIPSWAIRFAASQENVMMVLSGMSDMEQMLDNTSTMADFKPLTEEESATLMKAAELIKSHITVPCTGCSYCVAGCPMKIKIPDVFTIYNKKMAGEFVWKAYSELCKESGKAGDCIGCGQCEEVCPQHLNIRELMKEISRKLD